MEGALSLYLPNVLLHLSVTLSQSLHNLTLEDLHFLTSFIVQSLELLHQYLHKLSSSDSLSSLSTDSSSPFIEGKHFNTLMNPFKGSEKTLGSLIMALLHQSQSIIQVFVSTHVCDMEDVSSVEIINVAIKEALNCLGTPKVCKCIEEDILSRCLSGVCAVLMESLALLRSLPTHTQILGKRLSTFSFITNFNFRPMLFIIMAPCSSFSTSSY